MKKSAITLFLLLYLPLSTFAGEQTKTYSNKDFTEVSICCGMKLRLNQSDSYSVKVIADQKDFENIAVEQKGNSLSFYIKKNNYRIKDDIKIEISMPDLKAVNLSGGALGNINMKVKETFSADLSGGAILKGNIESKNTSLEMSGGSIVELKGSGGDLDIEGSGGCVFNLEGLSVKNVDSELSGGCNAKVKMNGTLNTSQSGGSLLTFYGNANIGNTSFSGGSEVVKGD